MLHAPLSPARTMPQRLLPLALLALSGLAASGLAAPAASAQDGALTLLGRYSTGLFDRGAAEISAYDPATRRLFMVSAIAAEIRILDLSNPAAPVSVGTVNLSAYGAGVNSVAVSNGLVAAAVEAAVRQDAGRVVVFSTDGTIRADAAVGALPDMVTFTPDGARLVVCNEGEPNAAYTVDPVGSVSVVDVTRGVGGSVTLGVRTAGFADFNTGGPRAAERPAGVRVFGPGASVAQDLEPEYAAISADSRTAYVTLQENNGLATVDLDAARVTRLTALGTKDHSLAANRFDASDRDNAAGTAGAINLRTWPVRGLYMPDAIAAFTAGGATFLVTANEGDAREYTGFVEAARVGTLTLDAARFPDGAALKANPALGRLSVSTAGADADRDGDIDTLYAFGARSFSVWNAQGSLVWDSGDRLETLIAARHPADFNSSNNANATFDTRSDDKGPEPEGVAVGVVGGRTYAFIGLERIGGVAVYDVTTPTAPTFAAYANFRDFSATGDRNTPAGLLGYGDLGPEGILFISAADSPTGGPLVVVSNEISGTVSVIAVNAARFVTSAARAQAPSGLGVALAGPHPIRGVSTVRVDVPTAGAARLVLHDALGRTAQTLFDGPAAPGASTEATLDATHLAPGLYVLRLTQGSAVVARTVVVAR